MSETKTNPLTGMASSMTDGMEMMRRMWGMTGLPQIPQFPTPAGIAQFAQGLPQALPSMITPTLDVDELDKRIADLRAVEQWLNLNATMLRTTIQTLEVQRNTIATLKSLGGNMLASMNARGSAGEPKMSAPEALRAAYGAALGGQDSSEHGAQDSAQSNAAGADWPPQRLRHDLATPTAAQTPKAPKPRAAKSRTASSGRTGSSKSAAAMPGNAAAWWGALQDQFARVAAAAVTPPLAAAKKTAAGKSAAGAPAASHAAANKAAVSKAVRKTARQTVEPKAAARPRRKAKASSG